jgi:arginase
MSHSLIFAECMTGQKKRGVDAGTILHTFFPDNIIKDYKKNRILWQHFETIFGYQLLYMLHQEHLQKNIIPITLGGDHSIGHITVGSSIQKYKDNILILWIDAHADINTFESSLSKNTHGTPVSGLIGLEKTWIPEIKHLLKPENLVYYGIRDLDDYEKDILNKNNIKTITITELKEKIKSYDNIHVSFDVDSLDNSYLDSTGTVAENGITPDEVIECFKICKDKIRAFDIVEFNPYIGDYHKSMETMKYIIDNIL